MKEENELRVNYFLKKSGDEKHKDNSKLKQVKEKIMKNMESYNKYSKAKSIPLNECFVLLKEHEKRVQVNVFKILKLKFHKPVKKKPPYKLRYDALTKYRVIIHFFITLLCDYLNLIIWF